MNEYRESGPTLELATVPRVHAWAVDVQDEGHGARVRLGGDELVVGTGRVADIVLHDGAVSGRHCAVSVLGGGVAIRDLGSRNGTFVGGARVREAWGGAGTIVTVGRSTLVFSAIDETEDDEPLPPALPGIAGTSAPMRRVAAQIPPPGSSLGAGPHRRRERYRQGAGGAGPARGGATASRAVRRAQRRSAPS